jgi:hypothetical protein
MVVLNYGGGIESGNEERGGKCHPGRRYKISWQTRRLREDGESRWEDGSDEVVCGAQGVTRRV